MVLKWLGEQGRNAGVKTAIAVSVPFCLNDCAMRLERGWSRIYQRYLINKLRRSYRRKFSNRTSPLVVNVQRLRSFRQFDNHITAPLHGFLNVDHYYGESSCRQYLGAIEIPTLIVHALDDPFMEPQTCPEEGELSSSVTLELSRTGGHVGFVAGTTPWNSHYWLNRRIIEHLTAEVPL